MTARRPTIGVIGAGAATPSLRELALEVGRQIGAHGATLVCGGRGGVMEAAEEGARAAGGNTIGIVPSYDLATANPHIEFVIATGMGAARNVIVVASSDALIALAGEAGTLSEIGLALKLGRPVVTLDAWAEIRGPHRAATPRAAVELALELARAHP